MCKGFAPSPSACIERAKEMKVHLGQLLLKSKATGDGGRVSPETHEEVITANRCGVSALRAFLRSEFSGENIDFWLACEDYRNTKSISKRSLKGHKIYNEFVQVKAPKEVNLDPLMREVATSNLVDLTRSCFQEAQQLIYHLMENDSFPRFLKSDYFLHLIKPVRP